MYYLGIDLGGTKIAAGIVGGDLKLIASESTPTLASRPTDEIIADIARVSRMAAEKAGIPFDRIEACGIASPGIANSKTGVIEYANNLKMNNYPIVEKLRSYTGIEKIYLENDANAAALGEYLAGANSDVECSVMITLGTGLGGGIIMGGKIYAGFNHVGPEIGHMVIEKGGRPCTCGRRGCWEAYSSATGLVNLTKDALIRHPESVMHKLIAQSGKINGRTAFVAMKEYNDEAGREVCEEYISYLATGLANVINILEPEVVSIGGGVSNEGDALFVPLIEQVRKLDFARRGDQHTKIVKAALGTDAGMIGAAALCLDR